MASMCIRCKNRPTRTPKAKRCAVCQKAVRKAQLKRNNVTWRARVKKGSAGHHLMYKGDQTKFIKTTENQKWKAKAREAIAEAKKEGTIYTKQYTKGHIGIPGARPAPKYKPFPKATVQVKGKQMKVKHPTAKARISHGAKKAVAAKPAAPKKVASVKHLAVTPKTSDLLARSAALAASA